MPRSSPIWRKMVGTESPGGANRRQRRLYAEELERSRQLLTPRRRKRFEKKLIRLRRYLGSGSRCATCH